MSTFKEILDGGFEAHARALPAGGGFSGDRSRSVLRSIHRRRTARAAATAGGSVLAVGVLAVGAMALRPSGVAQPGMTPPITNGLYPWCNLSTYPSINPEALGAERYQGRIYADFANKVYTFVAPDGTTHGALQPGADGNYRVVGADGVEVALIDAGQFDDLAHSRFSSMALDFIDGRMGIFYEPGGPDGPMLGYEWTTVVPDKVPAGVDVVALSSTLAWTTLSEGLSFAASSVPPGAVAEIVFRWHDGRQQAIPLHDEFPSSAVTDYTDLASVSLRVSNLPDGGVFEITSTYDPSKTWQAACWPYREFAWATPTPRVGPFPSPSYNSATPAPSIVLEDAGPTPTPSYVGSPPTPSPDRSSVTPAPSPPAPSPPAPSPSSPSPSPSPTS